MIPPLMGKKKAVGLILGGLGKDDAKKMEGGEAEASPLSVMARELIDAVKADDAEGVASALKACWSALEAEEYEAAEVE